MIYIVSFFISFIATIITTRIIIKLNFIDHPNELRWHKKPVATLGGVAIFFGFLVSIIFSLKTSNKFIDSKILFVLSGSLLMFFLGIVDDLKKISPEIKFIFQILNLFILYFVVGYTFNIFLFLWIIGIVNSLNLIDNMDGLSSGVSLIALLFIFEINIQNSEYFYALSSVALSGSCAGFLCFNFKPAKIFMGDCGSMLIGFLLSVLSYHSVSNKSIDIDSLWVPILILNIPIFDTLLVSLIRLKNGRMPWNGGKDHSSHRLVCILRGNEIHAVLIFYAICIYSGLLAVFLKNKNSFIQYTIFISIVTEMILFGILLSRVPYNYSQENKK